LTEPPAPVRESGWTADPEATLVERVHRSGTLPVTPAESAARARRAGPWYYAEHYLRTMRKYGAVIVFEALGEPLVYLLAMGLGLEPVTSLVRRSSREDVFLTLTGRCLVD